MEVEIESEAGTSKGEDTNSQTNYLSGYRPGRFDIRLGTIYLTILKVRKGEYVPFFLTEKKPSVQALIALYQKHWLMVFQGVNSTKICSRFNYGCDNKSLMIWRIFW